ncbi:MAG: hypothetical protein ACI9AO_001723, partial [Ilumatobacter sp.]
RRVGHLFSVARCCSQRPASTIAEPGERVGQ